MAEQKQSLEFKNLPEAVKTWLASSVITNLILEINRGLDLKELEKMRIIPTLILRLCMSDLDPKDFIKELEEKLNLKPEIANLLAERIVEKLLKPIEAPLRVQLGIDIREVFTEKPIPPTPQITATPAPLTPPKPTPPQPPQPSNVVKIPINVPKPPIPPAPPKI